MTTRSDTWRFSTRGNGLTDSAIRALTKRISMESGIVSFAGGMPSPATFPEAVFARAFDSVLRDSGKAALQYGPTDGFLPLRAWIADSLSTPGKTIAPEQVLITSGSQQALDLIGKVMLDPGDLVAVETPTYLGALQAFGMYFPRFLPIGSDDGGLIPERLDEALNHGPSDGRPCKILYVIPTFQNPTGRTLSLERRIALTEVCRRTGVPIVEDDPYGQLDYEGQRHKTLLSLGADDVVYMGTFSKILSPGIRLGYVVAPMPVARKLEMAKQASDLHTSTLMQRVVFEIVKDGFLTSHLEFCRSLYRTSALAMTSALERHLHGLAHWTAPAGGMFLWLELQEGIDASALLEKALAAGVAYVPGAPFFAVAPEANTLRLCFSTVSPEAIEQGIGVLGQVLRDSRSAL
ncbi:MAG: PLP-dependent aminotransferase family protein [Cupriavidus necator]